MTIAEDVAAAAAEVGASAQAAADRVIASLGSLRTELANATAQIEAFLASDQADTAVLTDTLATLANADAIVDSIEPAPAPEPEPIP